MRRSKHTLSNFRLSTFDMGQLIPIGLQEALPGDTWQLSTSALLRLSPLAAPVFHPTKVRIHHFFVPHRLSAKWGVEQDPETYDNFDFEKFITGGDDGNYNTPIPKITVNGDQGLIGNHLGIPPEATGASLSALPFWCYSMIWNDYYRDQDLETERTHTDNALIARIAWEKDYLAGARPFTQKGDDVTLPVGSKAPVYGIGAQDQIFPIQNADTYESGGDAARTYANSKQIGTSGPNQDFNVEEDPDNPGFPNIYADLSAATAINVNDFRKAFALQRYQEARARYGSRYTEYLRYLGVRPSDARLDRPEYLGGGVSNVAFSEVLQTTPDSSGEKTNYGVGDLYGHGISAFRTGKVRRFIEEHGYIMTLASIRPKAMYQQQIDRHWWKETKEDFYQKELEFIGQQPIYKSEVYFDPVGDAVAGGYQNNIFGYQDRYREYRETNSKAVSEFRNVLDFWHMARDLDDSVALNQDFIQCNPTKRIFNVQNQDTIWGLFNNHAVARRLVKKSAYARIL